MPAAEFIWSQWRHAYGRADDLPEILSSVTSMNVDEARTALIEIMTRLNHQCSVYPASSAAVPYLLDAVESPGYHRSDLLRLIGSMSDPRQSRGDAEIGAVRRVVGEQAARVARLLDDGDAEVRAAAAYTLGQAGAEAPVSAALASRWRVETDALVRSALVLAIDPPLPETEAAACFDGEPLVRAAAALALVRAGRELPAGTVEAVAGSYDEDPGLALADPWCERDVLVELSASAPIHQVQRLLRLLLHSRHATVRAQAVWALGERCARSRSATALLVPLLAEVINDDDPEVQSAAVIQAWSSGSSAVVLADQLAVVADAYPASAGGEWVSTAGFAVRALARLGDPRWPNPVARALAAGRDVTLLDLHPGNHTFSPAVLAEALRIRDRYSGDATVRRWFEAYLRSWYYTRHWAPQPDEPLTGDIAELRDLLSPGSAAVAGAAAALWRLGTPVDDLAAALVTALDPFDGTQLLRLLAEMRAVQAVPRLQQLAEQDQRITGPIVESTTIIWDDEQLRDQILTVIAALTTSG